MCSIRGSLISFTSVYEGFHDGALHVPELEGDRAVFKGGFNVGAFMRRISFCVAYRGLVTLGL